MISLAALGDCVASTWSPRIGDPTVMGWVTVGAYGVTAILCAYAYLPESDRRLRWFGLFLALLLAALMVNKQLDLQSALTATGRCLSRMQGWYEERRQFQYRFILGLLVVGAIAAGLLFRIMRAQVPRIRMALLGLVCLLLFIAVRAVGFHHFDAFINVRVQTVRMNWILELGGIGLIALNALWLVSKRHGRVRSRGPGQEN